MLNIQSANELCRLLSDSTRIRLLSVLAHEAMTVAELTEITGSSQSRVSTHLGKLRDAGMVRVRRQGTTSLYGLSPNSMPEAARAFWEGLQTNLDDPTLARDRDRVRAMVQARQVGTWADSVAGQMQRHYSPGRTWESYARSLFGWLRLGDVVDLASGDGVLAELIAPRARAVTCLDLSENVVQAGRRRLGHLPEVRFVQGDMHDAPLPDAAFDQALLMNALTYARDALQVLREAARVLKAGGDLLITTLVEHDHADAVAAYEHVNLGFTPERVEELADAAGFDVTSCEITHEERRAPHFRVITAHASKRENTP